MSEASLHKLLTKSPEIARRRNHMNIPTLDAITKFVRNSLYFFGTFAITYFKIIPLINLVKISEELKELKKEIGSLVEEKLREFKEMGKKGSEEWFNELCFCILTANYSALGGLRIQKKISDGFLTLSEGELKRRLRELGHRFPNKRAEYIVGARGHAKDLKEKVLSAKDPREWLVRNIRGIGYKEASHFLRNVGYEDYAILDYHILDLLEKEGIIKRPKTLTRKKYLEIEEKLRKIARRLGMNLAELDLYLWYKETGKVLK